MLKRVILVLVQLLFCRPSTPGVKLSSVTESAVAHTRVESVPATNATETVCCSTTLGPSPANTHQDGYGISAMDLEQVSVPVSTPEIKSITSKTTLEIGNCISLQCYSINGSFPVTYSLFLHKKLISTIKKLNNKPAIFNVLINNTEDGGVYKCKATNDIPGIYKYSEGIKFMIKGTTSYKWLYYTIPLLLLVGILVIICVKVGKNRISRRYKTQEQRNQDTNLNKTCSNEDKVIYTQLNLQAQKNKKAQQEGIVYATVKFNE